MWSALCPVAIVCQLLISTSAATYSDADYRLWQKNPLGVGAESIVGIAYHPTESSTLVLADSSGGLFRTDDLGFTWFPRAQNIPVHLARDTPFPGCRIQGVFYFPTPSGGATLFVTTTGGLFRSPDDGETFTLVSIPLSTRTATNLIEYQDPFKQMVAHPLNPDRVYVANGLIDDDMRDEPGVYFSEDGGLTFPRYTPLVMGLVAADINILVMDPLRLNCTFAAYGKGRTWNGIPMGGILAYTPDNGYDWDGIDSWWDDSNATFVSMYAKGVVESLVFSADGLSLAIAYDDRSIELGYRMNATSRWMVKRLIAPMYNFQSSPSVGSIGSRIRSLAFHPDWDWIGADKNWNGTFLYTLVSYNSTQFPNITNELYALNCTSMRYNPATEASANSMTYNSGWPWRTSNCKWKLDSAGGQVLAGGASPRPGSAATAAAAKEVGSQADWRPTKLIVPPASWRTPTVMWLAGPHELYMSQSSTAVRSSVYDSRYSCCGLHWSHFETMGSEGDPPRREWQPLCSTRVSRLSGFRGCGFEAVTITAVSGPPSEPDDVFVSTLNGIGQLSRDGGRSWHPAAADVHNALDAGGWTTPAMSTISMLVPVHSRKSRLLMVFTNTSGGSRAVVSYQGGKYVYMDIPANASGGFPPSDYAIQTLSSNARLPDQGHVSVQSKLYELRGMEKASEGFGGRMTSQLIGHREPVYNITVLNCTLFPHNCTQLGDETYQLPRTIINTTSAFTSIGYCNTCFLNSTACAVGSCAHTIYTTISEAVLRYTCNGIKTLRSRWTLGRVCTTSRYLTGLQTDCRELVSPRIELRTNVIYQQYSVQIYEHFQQVLTTSTGKMYLISNISIYEADQSNALIGSKYHAEWTRVLQASAWRPDRAMVFGHAAVIEGTPIQLVVGLMDHKYDGAQADWTFDPHASQVAIGVQTASGLSFSSTASSASTKPLWTAGEMPPDSVNFFWSPPRRTKKVYAVSAVSGLWSWHKDSLLQNGGFELYDLSLSEDAVNVGTRTVDALSGAILGWELSGTAQIAETKSAFGNRSAYLSSAGVVTTLENIPIDTNTLYRVTGWWSGAVTVRIVPTPNIDEHLIKILPATPGWRRFTLDISLQSGLSGIKLQLEGNSAGAAADHIWLGTTDESRMVGVADRGLIASFPPLACGAPVLTAATAGTLSIQWAAPPTTCVVHVDTCVYEAVSGYTIQYWLEDDISTLKTIEVGVGLSYKLTSLAYFRTYAMRVRATNIIGTGLWSDPSTAASLSQPPDAPDPPTLVTARSVELELQWSTPVSDGGSPIDAYRVEVLDIWYNTWSTVKDVAVVNTAEITGIEPDTAYTYRIRAHNSVGWGPVSLRSEEFSTKSELDSNTTIRMNLWEKPWTTNYPYGSFCYSYLPICAPFNAATREAQKTAYWNLLKLDLARALDCAPSRVVITAIWDNYEGPERDLKRGSHVSFWIKSSGIEGAPDVTELKRRLLWQIVDLETSKLHLGVVTGNGTLDSRYLYFDGEPQSDPSMEAARISLGGSSYRLDETSMQYILMVALGTMFCTQMGDRVLSWWRTREAAGAYKESF